MKRPFLFYLTIFRSRVGVCQSIVDLTGLYPLSDAALLRKFKALVSKTKLLRVDAVENDTVFSYLCQKGLLGPRLKKGRYTRNTLTKKEDAWVAHDREGKPADQIPVYQTDIWMSHSLVRSTIGVPTPDNAEEPLDLALDLGLLSKSRNTWTAAGQLFASLRSESLASLEDGTNPFLMGAESAVLLRQIISMDGLLLRELLRELVTTGETCKRDDLARKFPEIVNKAIEEARNSRLSSPVRLELREFKALIERTGQKRAKQSRAPGVLEHRLTPRLEWLVDLGYLAKPPDKKNSFEYEVLPLAESLLTDLDDLIGTPYWAESVSIRQWKKNPLWSPLREGLHNRDPAAAFRNAYRMMQRSIGPSPIDEVAFIAAMLLLSPEDEFEKTREDLVQLAQTTEGVSLAGGRYKRTPQNIFMSGAALQAGEND